MNYKNKIRIKLYSMIIVSVVILSVVAAAVSSYFYSQTLSERYKEISKSVCETTVGIIKDEDYEEFLAGNNTVEYIEVEEKVSELKETVSDIECIGVYKIEDEGMRTIIDTNSDEPKGGLGTVIGYDNTWRQYKYGLMQGEFMTDVHIMANTGMVTMYCVPVETLADGSPVYVCVGVSDKLIASDKKDFSDDNRSVIIALAFMIMVLSLAFVELRVVKPIRKISGFVNQAVERRDVAFIQEIMDRKVTTKNELENLYHSLIKIYTSKARLESAYEKSGTDDVNSTISLIKRMDKFAAAHLDNSLQYIIAIIRKMRESDKFSELLTDKICEDILLAAPLHDVGKLAIPDEIVNKPDKLDDREFEVMKEHSRLGAKIIEELYLKHSDEDYLYIAREIALSHHERWDGNGYPAGKKGEEIPLAVRIVSIADVFDALVSERVYKEPYSFEKAMEIVESYKGTFFDPDIAEIFIESRDDIYAVYKSISKNKVQA